MSIVEDARRAARNPVERAKSLDWNRSKSDLTRRFLAKEIDLEDYRTQQERLSIPEWVVTLPFPGPLYGLLRKIGLDKEGSKQITYEERKHYDTAQKAGVYDKVHIEFVGDECSGPNEDTTCGEMNVFISFNIPEDLPPNKVREIIRDILLAPPHPSDDDLAKLPENIG